MSFRKIIFWLHLICGVVAGLVIGIMSLTGVTLAFEKQIVAFAERDARLVTTLAPATPRLPLDELVVRARAANGSARPTGITVSADPSEAIAIAFGRAAVFYVNPYTGDVRTPASSGAREFMRTMENWHRWLAFPDAHRPVGRAITGVCNAAFLILAVTGSYLWWPRQWSRRALRAIARFDFKLAGRARDWNWHNTAGSWCALALIILTFSGMIMSYRWASDLLYRIAGESPPVAAPVRKPPPASSEIGRSASLATLLASAQRAFPEWRTMTFRLGDSRHPVTASVRTRATWPFFATTTITFDTVSGGIARREEFSDLGPGRRTRTWLRFLHTGEAFGPGGQFVAGLASLGGGLLVYTGLSLAWRRFFSRAA